MTGGAGRARIWMGMVATLMLASFGWAGSAQAANPLSPVQEWTQQSPANSPQPRFSTAMTFDPANGETVMFSGFFNGLPNDTWTWDGTSWTQESPATSPPGRNAASMAFDPNTGTVLLFGGITTSGFSNQTWSWDGTDWTLLSPANSPPARAGASMAFDASSGQMVLFGGTSGMLRNDTWTWNGSNWTQRSPATSPSARQGGSLAFDPSIGNIVLFGGSAFSGNLSDTWVWTGTSWVQQAPATAPNVEGGRGLAFDPLSGELVLFGVSESNPGTSETWSWDGSNWTQLDSPSNPLPVNAPGYTFDARSGNIVLYGGQAGASNNQTWTFGPPPGLKSQWFQQSPATSPPPVANSESTFDQSTGRTVIYGGFESPFVDTGETWNWDGSDWSDASPATSPPIDSGGTMIFDPTTGDALNLLGGFSPTTMQTWNWGGTDWSQLSPASAPSYRTAPSFAFDEASGTALMFGGALAQYYNETWSWDGSVWTELNPANSPGARAFASMAFDPATGTTVLFGGLGSNGQPINDTWIWNGTNWNQATPATSPSPRAQAKMAFDPTRGKIVLYGGQSFSATLGDTWTWDGTNWTDEGESGPGDPEGPIARPTFNFDPNSGGMVLFGGSDFGVVQDETWTYELVADPPEVEITSPGSGGSFTIGEPVDTTFVCEEGAGGPGLTAPCFDSNGDPPPNGELDTSALGSFNYSVSATSENGQTGSDQITYEVVKADPVLTTENPVQAVVGEPISIEAELSGGYQAGGTLTFKTFDPGPPACSQPVVFSESVPVSGDGTYESPDYLTQAAGTYFWAVEYSGDANNEAIATPCNDADSTSEVAKAQPTLTMTGATSTDLGGEVSASANLSEGFAPAGEVIFNAFGPDDPDCSGLPAYVSDWIPVDAPGDFNAPGFEPGDAGDFNWRAAYSGDPNNEPFHTECGAPDSISTVTDVGPVCPAVIYPFKVSTFKPNRKALNRQVPGVRIRLTTSFDMDAVIRPSYSYKVNGKVRTANLKQRSIRINGSRRFLFGIPSGMAKHLRKATGQVSRNKVTFKVEATLRIHGAGPECEQNANGSLRTRISGVSRKTALRRLAGW